MKYFLKEREKNRRFDRLIDFEKPNPLGIKWRFFLFSIILKNASFQSVSYIAVTSILYITMSILPSFYPILAKYQITEINFSQEEAIFPYSSLLSIISPTILPLKMCIILSIIFCVASIFCFIICLYEPSFTLYLHLILDIKIHMIFLPWTTGTIGYAIYVASNYDEIDSIGLWYCIIPIFIFPFYIFIISLLNFSDMNSIVKPNSTITGWFVSFPFYQPTIYALISLVGYQCINWPRIVTYIGLVIVIIICIIVGVWALITSPFLLFISNEILATQMFTVSSFFIFSLFFIEFDVSFTSISVATIPVFSLIIFLISHFIFQYRSSSFGQILSQINTDLEQLTADSLQATLSPLTHQISLAQIVKEGLLAGNKAVLSEVFIQYCLDCYPNSEWFLGYVAFLYGLIWKNDPSVYRFLLHLLSLDTFSMPIEYTLFQYVYCFMQISQTLSPMIMRRLSKYRETVLKYVVAHKTFWLSAIKSEPKNFQKTKTQMFRLFLDVQKQARVLELMFPFCPCVRCELSLYEADLAHNIINADNQYTIASSLLRNNSEFVTSSLFDYFMIYFPNTRRYFQQIQEDPVDPNQYRFLSFQEHYNDAHRQGISLNPNDTYLTSLTHTFTMSRNQPQIDPKVDRIRLFFTKFVLLFTILVYIGLIIFHHMIDPGLVDSIDSIESLNDILNATTHFRYDINRIQFDVDLLMNIINCTYSDGCDDYNLFLFVMEHLSYAESSILSYKYKLDSFEYLKENTSIIDCCDNINCSFSYLFGVIHEICLFFLNSNEVKNVSKIGLHHNMNLITQSLAKVIDNIYDLVYKVFVDKSENSFKNIQTYLYILISIEIFMAIVMSIVTSLLLKRMKDNITDVIRTAQPPIIQYIANQFDKLLSFDKYQNVEVNSYGYGQIEIPYVLMFAVLLIYPILVLSKIPGYSIFEFNRKPLSQIINCTEETQFLYYSLAMLEYSTYSSRNTPVSSYRQIVESYHSCFHNTFSLNEEEVEKNPVQIVMKNKFLKQKMYAIHGSLIALSALIFIVFLRSVYLEMSIVKIGRLLLKFIPSSAAQSNPVFAKLLRGQIISKSDVSQFTHSIKIENDDLSFFCILYYDFSGKITHSVGDVKKYLTVNAPQTIDDLAQLLIEKCKDELPEKDINLFFLNKTENEPLNVSFFPNHEITLLFSKNPDSIVIKDDSSHYEANSKSRMIKRLNKALNIYLPNNLKVIQKVVISMVYADSTNLLSQIKNLILSFNQFIIVDSRNHVVAFIINAESDEKVACEFALNFVNNELALFLNSIKLAMTVGGPLSFFDSMKNQTTKSRCVGSCYDSAKLLLNDADFGVPLITKDVYQKAGVDISSFDFVEKEIADDITVTVKV